VYQILSKKHDPCIESFHRRNNLIDFFIGALKTFHRRNNSIDFFIGALKTFHRRNNLIDFFIGALKSSFVILLFIKL
jgi:hypothetical protein